MSVCAAALVAAVTITPCKAAAAYAASPVMTLVYEDTVFEYTDDYPDPPDFLTGEEYARRGLDLSAERRLEIVDEAISAGSDVKSAMLYCFPALRRTVDDALAEVRKDPVDAEMRFDPDETPMFEIKRSEPGYSLDESRVYADIYFAMRRGSHRVLLSPEVRLPKVTAAELAACTRMRSKFSTSVSSSTEDRKHNIELALSRVNGTRLGPGESFSFNSAVGRRTEANGFRRAKIIVGGEYTDGVGGGVCQASTTLYNAALLAGLKITAVRRHTLVPGYVDPSFDAMVNGSGSDLCFVNDDADAVYIRAYVSGGRATAEIYSSELPYKIALRSVTLSVGERPTDREFTDTERKYTEGMESGEKIRVSGGAPSVSSEGYLIKEYPDGRREETRIRRDDYSSSAGKIAVAP